MTPDGPGVGLLVYDRPAHTREVLSGLSRNEIDTLYVFADGPGPEADTDAIEATRAAVRNVDFCDVELVAREENLGVRRSFIEAYEHLFERHDSAIIFEDDCVPAGDCLDYMRACLDEYRDVDRVMNIHGYGPPIDVPDRYDHDVYFTWRTGSWGQATWQGAWEKYDEDPSLLDRVETDEEFSRKVQRAGPDLLPMLRQAVHGEIDSVGVWWALTLIRHDGLSVNPVQSRVRNIGIDGTGVHSGTSTNYRVEIDEDASFDGLSFPDSVGVDPELNDRYNTFMGEGLRGRVRRWIKERIRSLRR